MRPNDKRSLTSRLNALKSTSPKTEKGKQSAANNAIIHGAYAKDLILPGEDLTDFQRLLTTHLETWRPTNPVEEIFDTEMATTVWRLRRQAPAEACLIHVQIQRMSPALKVEFETVNSHFAYALAVASLQNHRDALSQIARQRRRLLHHYEKLCHQLITLRQLLPPTTPGPEVEPEVERIEKEQTPNKPKTQQQKNNRISRKGQSSKQQPVNY